MVLEFIGAAGVAAIVGGTWKLGRQMEGMDRHFTARMDGMEKHFTARMDGMEQHFTARMDGMEKHFTARMDGMEQRFNARIDGIEVRLGNLEREVHDIRADIRSINEHLRRPSAEQASAVGGA